MDNHVAPFQTLAVCVLLWWVVGSLTKSTSHRGQVDKAVHTMLLSSITVGRDEQQTIYPIEPKWFWIYLWDSLHKHCSNCSSFFSSNLLAACTRSSLEYTCSNLHSVISAQSSIALENCCSWLDHTSSKHSLVQLLDTFPHWVATRKNKEVPLPGPKRGLFFRVIRKHIYIGYTNHHILHDR